MLAYRYQQYQRHLIATKTKKYLNCLNTYSKLEMSSPSDCHNPSDSLCPPTTTMSAKFWRVGLLPTPPLGIHVHVYVKYTRVHTSSVLLCQFQNAIAMECHPIPVFQSVCTSPLLDSSVHTCTRDVYTATVVYTRTDIDIAIAAIL